MLGWGLDLGIQMLIEMEATAASADPIQEYGLYWGCFEAKAIF